MPIRRTRGRRVDVARRRADLSAELRKIAKRLGPNVSLTRFCREADIPHLQVYHYFENWAELRIEAGLPELVDRSLATARYTRESLIEALQQVAASVGPEVRLKDFQHHTGISSQPIYRLFGNWLDFKAAAGVTGARRRVSPGSQTWETLQEQLREAVKCMGRGITLLQFCDVTGLNSTAVHRLGGWGELRLSLGLSRCGASGAGRPSLR